MQITSYYLCVSISLTRILSSILVKTYLEISVAICRYPKRHNNPIGPQRGSVLLFSDSSAP